MQFLNANLYSLLRNRTSGKRYYRVAEQTDRKLWGLIQIHYVVSGDGDFIAIYEHQKNL